MDKKEMENQDGAKGGAQDNQEKDLEYPISCRSTSSELFTHQPSYEMKAASEIFPVQSGATAVVAAEEAFPVRLSCNTEKNGILFIDGMYVGQKRNELEKVFSKFGRIRDVKLIVEGDHSHGYVVFQDPDAVNYVMHQMDGQCLKDRRTIKTIWKPRE